MEGSTPVARTGPEVTVSEKASDKNHRREETCGVQLFPWEDSPCTVGLGERNPSLLRRREGYTGWKQGRLDSRVRDCHAAVGGRCLRAPGQPLPTIHDSNVQAALRKTKLRISDGFPFSKEFIFPS